jgi:hypothetical protein
VIFSGYFGFLHQELASIQVLARLSLGFAIFITGWIGGELADVFKDEQQSRWQKYKHSF